MYTTIDENCTVHTLGGPIFCGYNEHISIKKILKRTTKKYSRDGGVHDSNKRTSRFIFIIINMVFFFIRLYIPLSTVVPREFKGTNYQF